MENSITQENTTETMDIEAKIPLAQKATHIISGKPTGKVNPTTAHPIVNAPKIKKPVNRTNPNRTSIRNKNVHKDLIRPERTRSSEEMNKSLSNITASTYINGNEVSTSSGIGLDFENFIAPEQQKLNCDRDSVYSGVSSNDRFSHRSHDMLSESGNLLLRRESSSTYERDMDIISLLERERSMNEIIEHERNTERFRKKVPTKRSNSGVERRKLPDITKITAAPPSPKRQISSSSTAAAAAAIEQSGNFPNFVFTHQFNEFAEARSNRNRDSNTVTANIVTARSRNNSQTSFGKRNSDAYPWNDDESGVGNVNRVSRARSIDSRKGSTKSIHDNRIIAADNSHTYAGSTYANNM